MVTFAPSSRSARTLSAETALQHSSPGLVTASSGIDRRSALGAPVAGLALWVLPRPAWSAAEGKREEVAAALTALKDLQGRWAEFSAAGDSGSAAAAEALLQVLGTSLENTLQVTVPEGKPLGVEIEGKNIVGLNQRGMGFRVSDTIEEVNGVAAEDQEDLMSKIQKAKEKGGPIVLTLTRREKSPFVTINKALRLIYEDTSSSVPETDEVAGRISSLKSKASLLADGVYTLEEIRKRLDAVVVDLEAYANSVPLAEGRVTKQAQPAGGSDMSDLFGS